jgi:hypothetical protein
MHVQVQIFRGDVKITDIFWSIIGNDQPLDCTVVSWEIP